MPQTWGTQQKMIKENSNGTLLIPIDLAWCKVHFNHRIPTTEETTSLDQNCLTQGDTPGTRHQFRIKLQTNSTSKSLKLRTTMPL